MIFEVTHIDRGEGKTEWGAEKGKEYFRIHLGRRLKDYPKPIEIIEGTDEDFF